jgi:hypothetical protein
MARYNPANDEFDSSSMLGERKNQPSNNFSSPLPPTLRPNAPLPIPEAPSIKTPEAPLPRQETPDISVPPTRPTPEIFVSPNPRSPERPEPKEIDETGWTEATRPQVAYDEGFVANDAFNKMNPEDPYGRASSYKKGGTVKSKYVDKSGRLNLGSGRISTHTPSKKSSNW